MFQNNRVEVSQGRYLIKTRCENEITLLLKHGEEYFDALFPSAKVKVVGASDSRLYTSKEILEQKHNSLLKWTDSVLEVSIAVSNGGCFADDLPSIKLPESIAKLVLNACLEIQSHSRDYSDEDYYFLYQLGAAMSLKPSLVYGIIEQVNYNNRKKVFLDLKKQLTHDQKEICAYLMLKAIRADHKVHTAEIKYFEIVSSLLDNDQMRLESIDTDSEHLEEMLPICLPDEIAAFLFKYLIEIVMCDKKYDSEESQYINDIAKAFGLDQARRDNILQPIAAALMVKADLFQQ